MSIPAHLADVRLADHQLPAAFTCSFWISADRPGWTVWFTTVATSGCGPARCETFNTRYEAEAYVKGVTYAVGVLATHAKAKARQ